MKRFINKWLKKWLTKWVLKNYPFAVTVRVWRIRTVYVKKGKMREWRSYNIDTGERLKDVIF